MDWTGLWLMTGSGLSDQRFQISSEIKIREFWPKDSGGQDTGPTVMHSLGPVWRDVTHALRLM